MGKTKTAFVGSTDEKENKKNANKRIEKSEKIHVAGLKGGQRIKAIESEPIPTVTEETKEAEKKAKGPRVRGKKYQEAKARVDPEQHYPIKEAIKLVKATSYSKFDGTMELHLQVKKTGLSANLTLPHSFGKEKKIEVANDDTITKLKAGKIDFDVLIATPDFMPKLVPFARTLGPKGLMPNPKNGTLISDIKKAKNFSTSSVAIKTEKDAPLIHLAYGKVSQKDEDLIENAEAIFKALGGTKQIIKASTGATMSPSVKIQL